MHFTGKYKQSLDTKGRVIVPQAFREGLGSGFMIGLNAAGTNIAFYPAEKWNSMLEDLMCLPTTDEEAVDYIRFISGNSFEDNNVDEHGRVLLPQGLRDMFCLGSDVYFVGMVDHIELWDMAEYLAHIEHARATMSTRLKHINELKKEARGQERDGK